jgi:hypothetical protein
MRSGRHEDKAGSASLKGLVRDILAMAGESERARAATPREIEKDFHSIARRDYDLCLKLNFSKRELSEILEAFRTALPNLDRKQFKPMPLPRLANVASSLGLKFRADPFDGPSGAGLRGFYVATKALKQPIMCLNTVHHRTAINSAFWHEMGHHLTARLLSLQDGSTALSFGSDFDEHLDDPRELAADMLVSLVCYSHSAAKRLFSPLCERARLRTYTPSFQLRSPGLSMGIQFPTSRFRRHRICIIWLG